MRGSRPEGFGLGLDTTVKRAKDTAGHWGHFLLGRALFATYRSNACPFGTARSMTREVDTSHCPGLVPPCPRPPHVLAAGPAGTAPLLALPSLRPAVRTQKQTRTVQAAPRSGHDQRDARAAPSWPTAPAGARPLQSPRPLAPARGGGVGVLGALDTALRALGSLTANPSPGGRAPAPGVAGGWCEGRWRVLEPLSRFLALSPAPAPRRGRVPPRSGPCGSGLSAVPCPGSERPRRPPRAPRAPPGLSWSCSGAKVTKRGTERGASGKLSQALVPALPERKETSLLLEFSAARAVIS